MHSNDTHGIRLPGFILSLVFLLLACCALQAQEVQQVYEALQGPGNNLEVTTAWGVPSEQHLPQPQTLSAKPATSLSIASTFVVTTTADTGDGSLRRAIGFSNASPGLDLISFNISGGGVQTITPLSPLPQLNDPVIIDGTTQPGYAGTPIIEINGASAGSGVNGLMLAGGSSVVRGLVINRFRASVALGNGYGIILTGSGGNLVEGNYLGLNVVGTDSLSNELGVGIFGASGGNTIGGTTAAARNVISGNRSTGIAIGTATPGGNIIRGNYIGITASGNAVLGNRGNGIYVDAPNNTIGGLVVGSGNVISGNVLPGIFLNPPASGSTVQGNYIGTDPSGSFNFGNLSNGINMRSSNNTIGAIALAGRNIVSGGGSTGIYIFNTAATGNKIINNYIGTDVTGTYPFPNTKGIVLDNAQRNTIGGATVEEGNVIAGNSLQGIDILNVGATANKILNNFIGTNADDWSEIGNGLSGITVNSSLDTIRLNTIAYNNGSGIFISAGTQNLLQENSIYSNALLAIDLAPLGLTKNDALDFDTGPNNMQNFPILDSAQVTEEETIIHWRLNSNPNSVFRIDFYENSRNDESHFGEGETWIFQTTATTDAAGNASGSAVMAPFVIGSNIYVTATATNAQGNTSEFSQALCTFDTDGDGILDSWETQGWGIDVNSDGIIDLDLDSLGASPDHKDIFVEVDAMAGMAPQPGTLDSVVAAFNRAPAALVNNPDEADGVTLHCLPLDETTIPVAPWPVDWWQFFHLLKQERFGTVAQRTSPNAQYILEAKRLVYRYCVFAHSFDGSSGISENTRGGNDFMVTLGTFNTPGGTEEQKSGTFMHELGHTLGLRHGGGNNRNYKPNYVSIMNYTWQFKYRWSPVFWKLDYSTFAIPTLDESNLNETNGFGLTSSPQSIIGIPYSDATRTTQYAFLAPNTGVDWNGDGILNAGSVAVDVNVFNPNVNPSPGDTLTGQSDWDKLLYNFRHSPNFPDITTLSRLSGTDEEEMSWETFQSLDNIPPPKPHGKFVMDGQLDTSAVLVATNGGINLYARYKSGQLYLATNSAQSQGADMFIFLSDARNPLRNAPSGKAGQVAGWTAYLSNESTDNSSHWSDAAESSLNSISVDTAGAVLEGVMYVDLLHGRALANLYIAVGKYETDGSGNLLLQVPAGNGNANIDPQELFRLSDSPPPSTYYTQQGNKLVGSGAVIGANGVQQGNGVALSFDGNTAIVGASSDNNAGASWVYVRNGETWTQQGNKLVGSGAVGNARQGASVAISHDGNTAIVGGIGDNNFVGAAWVFTRSGNVWSQQGSKLVGTGAVGSAWQGYDVALSADGNTALVGGIQDNAMIGAAWVFTRSAGVWSQQGTKLVGTGAISVNGVFQGVSVSLSGDGNTAIVGGHGDSSGRGAAWIFTRSNGVWTQLGNKLNGSSAATNGGQGRGVDLSSDGNTALIGGPGDNGGMGAVWAFTRQGVAWVQQGTKLIATGAIGNAGQGYSVSLSSDGNTAVIGGWTDSSSAGAAWIFSRTNGVWSQQGNKIVGTGAINAPHPAHQGYAVALSPDGFTAIIGGPNDNQSFGAAWVFIREFPLPIQLGAFTASIVNGDDVRLDWTTITETNNYGFEVQRKVEGQQEFQTLPNSFIPGHGTTLEPQYYSFVDVTATPAHWYYRLRQIDLDGSVHYTDGVAINTLTGVSDGQLPDKFSLSQNYPDPFNPSTTIEYQLPKAVHVTLKIYNVLGQEVATLVDDVQNAGYKAVVWNATNVASGIYFYRLHTTDFVQTRKLLLLR